MTRPGSDPPNDLNSLLSAGRYQEILDRYPDPGESAFAGEPAAALAVATAATRLGRFPVGERLASAAMREFRAKADQDGRLRSTNLLGAISYERGAIDDATARWTDALAVARVLGDTTMVARTSNNLATTYYYAGRIDLALSTYREAELAYQRLGDRRGLAEVLHNQAIIRRMGGLNDEAETLGMEAVRHAESVGDPVLLGLMLAGRAETLVDRGDLAVAGRLLDRAAQLCAEASDPLGLAEIDRIGAEAALRGDQPALALERARRGWSAAIEHGSRLLQGECSALMSRALARLDRSAEAAEARDRARTIFTELGAVLWLERLANE